MARDWQRVLNHAEGVSRDLWAIYHEHLRRWTEVANFFYPTALPGLRSGISDQRLGRVDEDMRALATRYPQEQMRKGAAGFAVNLTNPARQWFKLALGMDVGLDKGAIGRAERALEALTRAERRIFEASGIYQQLNRLYEHLMTFGTGCMLITGATRPSGYRIVDCITLRFGTYALGIGSDGRVNRVCRRFRWTEDQLVQEFGIDALPEEVVRSWREGKGSRGRGWVVSHLLEPNGQNGIPDEIAKACGIPDAASFAYRSIYWLDGGKNTKRGSVIACRGLAYNPIVAPRLEFEHGDVWGRGRGEDALPNARLLAALREDDINVSGNHADPALIVSSELESSGVRLGRGEVTYADLTKGPVSVAAVPVPGSITYNDKVGDEIRQELAETFLVTRFAIIDAMKSNPGVKTATEVEQLVRENMGLLGPVVHNLDHELLDPLVTVVAAYAIETAQRLMLDMTPLEPINENGMRIEYTSAIHRAQRADEVSAIQQGAQFIMAMAQANPNIIDVLNIDEMAQHYLDAVGMPEETQALPEEIEQARAARAKQMQQAQQMAMLQQGAQTLRDAGAGIKTLREDPSKQQPTPHSQG